MDQQLLVLIVSIYLGLVLCALQCVPNSSWEPICERGCKSLNTCSKFKDQKCFCKEGYYRNRVTGGCIEKHQCSTRRAYVKFCIDRSSKLQRCEKTCGEHDVCEHKPFQICHCRNRFYKDTVTEECVRKNRCTRKVQEKCLVNSSAKANCERSCNNKSCIERQGVRCFCKKGFFRDLDSGRCVREVDCPPRTCSARKKCEYSCFGAKCERVKRDCYCLAGLFRDAYSMECVESHDCKKVQASIKNLISWSDVLVRPIYVKDGEGSHSRRLTNWNLTL